MLVQADSGAVDIPLEPWELLAQDVTPLLGPDALPVRVERYGEQQDIALPLPCVCLLKGALAIIFACCKPGLLHLNEL